VRIAEEAGNGCACALVCRVGELAEIVGATPFTGINFENPSCIFCLVI
jgi:hypothetical protein